MILLLFVLLITAGGCRETPADENLRKMGFPSLSDIPDGFAPVDAKTMDLGDWCELIFESNRGESFSLDCYESGTFDTAFLLHYAEQTEQRTVGGQEATVYKNLSETNRNLLSWQDEPNQALCLLGGTLSVEELVQIAESIEYDREKAVPTAENSKITAYPKERGTIEQASLETLSDCLERITSPLFELSMENDQAIKKFTLESFYKSFDFSVADDLFVEVFDYDYFMEADDEVTMAGGMTREENGIIRGFNGAFGQLATVSRDGQRIKAFFVVNQDMKLNPTGADEEELNRIQENLLASMKSPACLIRNALSN